MGFSSLYTTCNGLTDDVRRQVTTKISSRPGPVVMFFLETTDSAYLLHGTWKPNPGKKSVSDTNTVNTTEPTSH